MHTFDNLDDIVSAAVGKLVRDFGARAVTMFLEQDDRAMRLGASGDQGLTPDETFRVVAGTTTVSVSVAFGLDADCEAREEAGIFAMSAARAYATLIAPPMGVPREARILIVDDDDGIRMFVRRVLQREGYTVLEASNGLIGHARALEFHPDLIVMDWVMPVLDGRDAARRLRVDPFTADIPIVMLTSHAQEADRAAALEAGVSDFLSKPLLPAALTASVRRNLRWNGTRNAAKEAIRASS